MKGYAPGLFGLMLSLPFALGGATLATPLTVTLVTDLADGIVDIVNPSKSTPADGVRVDIRTLTHTIPVDGEEIWDFWDYKFDKVDPTFVQEFRVRRPSWGTTERVVSPPSYNQACETDKQCDVSVIADPGVPFVHIMLVGEHPEDIRVNGHEDAVKLSCRDTN